MDDGLIYSSCCKSTELGRTAGNVTLQLPFTVKKSSYHALPSLQVLYVGEQVSKKVVHHLLKVHVALSVHAARRKPPCRVAGSERRKTPFSSLCSNSPA